MDACKNSDSAPLSRSFRATNASEAATLAIEKDVISVPSPASPFENN